MSVLLPEALTRVIADVHQVDFDEVCQRKLVGNYEAKVYMYNTHKHYCLHRGYKNVNIRA